MKPINIIKNLHESFTLKTTSGYIIRTTEPVQKEYSINKTADYISGLCVGDTVGLRYIQTKNSNTTATIKNITKDYIELDIWDEPTESLRKAQMFSTKNIEICSNEIRFYSFEKLEGKKYSTLMFVEIEKPMNEDNLPSRNRVSTIDIHNGDFQFADKLEELGYEYMLSLGEESTGGFSITIYKETSGNEDFIIIRTDDLPDITKVDHNGESLFFSEKEVALLDKDLEEE